MAVNRKTGVIGRVGGWFGKLIGVSHVAAGSRMVTDSFNALKRAEHERDGVIVQQDDVIFEKGTATDEDLLMLVSHALDKGWDNIEVEETDKNSMKKIREVFGSAGIAVNGMPLRDNADRQKDIQSEAHRKFARLATSSGWDEDFIARQMKHFALATTMWAVSTIGLIVYGAYAVFSGGLDSLLGTAVLMFAGVIATFSLRSYYRFWQLDNRRLGDWKTFVRGLVPGKSAQMAAALFMFVSAALLMAGDASALSYDEIKNAAVGDRAMGWLGEIFGGLFGGEDKTTFGSIIKTFNTIVLVVAAVFLGYGLTASIAQTAHEGVVLGKRYSALWTPIRIAIASVALIPLPSGYTTLQQLTAVTVEAGIGAANITWTAFVDTVFNEGMPLGRPLPPNIDSLVREMIDLQVCKHVVDFSLQLENNQSANQVTPGIIVSHSNTLMSSTSGGIKRLSWSFDGTKESGLGISDCGRVEIRIPFDGMTAEAVETMEQTHTAAFQELLDGTDAIARTLAVRALRFTADGSLVASPDYKDLVLLKENFSKVFAPAYQATMVAIQQRQKADYQAYRQSKSDFMGSSSDPESMKTAAMISGGWTDAGLWFKRMSEYQVTMINEVNITPEIAARPSLESADQFGVVYADVDREVKTWWRSASNARAETLYGSESITGSSGGIDERQSSGGSIRTMLGRYFDPAKWQGVIGIGDITDQQGESVGFSNKPEWNDPMGEMVTMGHNLINVSYVAASGYLLAIGGSGATKATNDSIAGKVIGMIPIVGQAKDATIGFISATIEAIGPVVMMIGLALLAAGMMLAYLVPMMPYFIWIMAVLGWMTLVIEAVVAAPLWALSHTKFEGDGFAGTAGQVGYLVYLNIIIRPVLMIIGLIAGAILFRVYAGFIGETFYAGWREVLNGHYGFLDGMLVGVIVFAMVTVLVIEKCFALIHIVPDRVMRWMGGQSEGLGEEQAAEKSRAYGAIAVGRVAGVGQTAGGAMQRQADKGGEDGIMGAVGKGGSGQNERSDDLIDQQQTRGAGTQASSRDNTDI